MRRLERGNAIKRRGASALRRGARRAHNGMALSRLHRAARCLCARAHRATRSRAARVAETAATAVSTCRRIRAERRRKLGAKQASWRHGGGSAGGNGVTYGKTAMAQSYRNKMAA
jgi:hypothetical protein